VLQLILNFTFNFAGLGWIFYSFPLNAKVLWGLFVLGGGVDLEGSAFGEGLGCFFSGALE
jgi:hypothetical protein